MNEAFSKVFQIVIIFWLILGALAVAVGPRIGTYFLSDSSINSLKSANTFSGIELLWNVASFQVTEQVPLFVSIILDALIILTGIAVIMAVTNR